VQLGRMIAGLSALVQGQAWSRAQVEQFQTERLRSLVAHAYTSVPYYRRLFDEAGVAPEHIRTLGDLQKIPITTRTTLQRLPDSDIIACGVDAAQLKSHRTGGSSGSPLSIRRTRFEDLLLQACRLRILFRLGMRLTDSRAAVVTARNQRVALYHRFGLLGYEEIDCRLPAEEMLRKIKQANPQVLRGYPSVLSWLSQHMSESDRQTIRPRFVTADSEMMTPDMRLRITEAFGSPVIDFYDSHEFNLIAWECAVGGQYHVSDSTMIAEVLSDGRAAAPGEEGVLIGTALHSWAMPFIRFQLDDWVTRGPAEGCACGAVNSTLHGVQGRLVHRFALPDGSTIHPYRLVNPLLSVAAWAERFQIIQERRDLIRVKLVPPGDLPDPDGATKRVQERLGAELGEQVTFEIELVQEIPPEANGKFRPYYSQVARPPD
jgi:phenylacetate-CoA ligase